MERDGDIQTDEEISLSINKERDRAIHIDTWRDLSSQKQGEIQKQIERWEISVAREKEINRDIQTDKEISLFINKERDRAIHIDIWREISSQGKSECDRDIERQRG